MAAAASVAGAHAAGCSLLTSLDGLSGGVIETSDGAGPAAAVDAGSDGPRADAATSGDGAPNDASGPKVGTVYVFGGATDAGAVAAVLAADIHADGTLGAWTSMTALPKPRTYGAAVVGQGFVAIVGGSEGGVYAPSTLVSSIGSNGLGGWSALGQFAIPRVRHAAALANDRLYVLGGTDATGASTADVQVAPVSTNAVGAWASTASLPLPRSRIAVASTSKFVYVFGGSDAANMAVVDVNRAAIAIDGTLGAFEAQPALPGARTHAQANVVTPGHILVTGGENVANNAIVYDIDAMVGSLGAPRSTLPLPQPTDHHAMVSFGSHVYVIGGFRNTSVRLADVVVGDVAADGTITRWTATTSLPTTLAYHSAAAF